MINKIISHYRILEELGRGGTFNSERNIIAWCRAAKDKIE
jgi:hypothetical protein